VSLYDTRTGRPRSADAATHRAAKPRAPAPQTSKLRAGRACAPRPPGRARSAGRARIRLQGASNDLDHPRHRGRLLGRPDGPVAAAADPRDPAARLLRRRLDPLFRDPVRRLRSVDRLWGREQRPAADRPELRRPPRHGLDDRGRPRLWVLSQVPRGRRAGGCEAATARASCRGGSRPGGQAGAGRHAPKDSQGARTPAG
jgi:hypothetical protein